MRVVTAILVALEGFFGLANGYLLLLLAAAASRRGDAPPARVGVPPRFVVLVPAHDEEAGIGPAVAGLRRLDYPPARYEVVVVADNCADRTADAARAAGATVYERTDPRRRGKGYALAWALPRVLAERPAVEAVAFVDADCEVSPNLLTAMAARLRAGAGAVQTDNVVANPSESWSSGLRYAAFALINTVAPRGKERLGLSCGLHGTGMALSRDLLERHPWQSFALAEDGEYHLRLVAAGERVAFAHEAWVRSAMPTTLRAARQQQLRYEGGKWELVRAWSPRLVGQGLRRRDARRLHAGLEPLVPPQSLLLAGNVALLATAGALGRPLARRLALANVVGQVGYIVGGLLLARAPRQVYRSLALAPVLMVWKLGLYGAMLAGRGPRQWVRTTRNPAARR